MPELKTEDVVMWINQFKKFIESTYETELLQNKNTGNNTLIIDFNNVAKFSPELAEFLLDYSKDAVECLQRACKEIADLPDFEVFIKNLNKSIYKRIKDIRSSDIGKFLAIPGIIRTAGKPRSRIKSITFECPSCGNILRAEQIKAVTHEPRCACGRKGHLKVLSKQMIDIQYISIEESPEMRGDSDVAIQRREIYLEGSLVDPTLDKLIRPGNRVVINGWIEEKPLFLKSEKQERQTITDAIIKANWIEIMETEFEEINLNPEKVKEIHDLWAGRKPKEVMDAVKQSVCPNIFGYDDVKEAIILQMIGGNMKVRADKTKIRGLIHIGLWGDPGVAKTKLLESAYQVAPKARIIAGAKTSKVGITASVIKDETTGTYVLEAGALILANNGLLCIDEVNLMNPDDIVALQEGMENMRITVTKANINATLNANTSILMAGNPKFGRFDPVDPVLQQIEIPAPLINRLDLMFVIKDIPNEKRDSEMADFILNGHKNTGVLAELTTSFLREYFAYARQLAPKITEEAIAVLKKFYMELRSAKTSDSKQVQIAPRQLDSLVRLSEAHAKFRLSDTVDRIDAEVAIGKVKKFLMDFGMDEETGKIDIDKIFTGVPSSKREKYQIVEGIIRTISENSPGKIARFDSIQDLTSARGIDSAELEELVEEMKKRGDIFEPKGGYWQIV
jgi:replicative DNA helicase Mcm